MISESNKTSTNPNKVNQINKQKRFLTVGIMQIKELSYMDIALQEYNTIRCIVLSKIVFQLRTFE